MSAASPPPVATPRPAAFAFVFVTVLLDMLALGVVLPVLPRLIESFVSGDTPRAAHIFGIFGSAWALMQFLFSPVIGALSDRFGRRPVILLSNAGLAGNYLLMALAPSLGWLFVGRLLSGITSASISTANAYIADVTPPAQRAARFGMLGAAVGAGFVLGPGLGGLLGSLDLRLPFWVAAAFSTLNFGYGLLVLPESLPRDRRGPISLSNANPLGSLRLLRATPALRALSTMTFLFNLAQYALNSVFVLYAGYRYHWDAAQVGFALMLAGGCSIIVQAVLLRRLTKHYSEQQLLVAGMLCGIAGFVVFGISSAGWGFMLAILLNSLWGMTGPSTMGLITRATPGDQHGRLQGGLSSLSGIAGLAGPLLFTGVFGYFIAPGSPCNLPGAPFLLAALLVVLAMWVARSVLRTPGYTP